MDRCKQICDDRLRCRFHSAESFPSPTDRSRSPRPTPHRSGGAPIDHGSGCAWSRRSTARPWSTASRRGLSSDNDFGVLQQLRSVAEVIIVGAGTVRGEGYGKPKKHGQRIGVVTRSGSVDTTSELFRSGAGFVITTEQAEIDGGHVDVLRAGVDEVDLRAAVERLPELCPGVDVRPGRGRRHAQRRARRRRPVRRAERDDVTGHGRWGRPSPLRRRGRPCAPLRLGATRRRRRIVRVQPLAPARGADFSMSSSSRWKSAAASKCL